ncbi:MAG: carbohydrate kinase family protein [Methanomicrobiales archaeon]|nr:carbohydrate kinase family protein [Methanomicrobiales archaeon]
MIHVVGHTARDQLFRVEKFPERHASSPVRDHHTYFGGGGANVAAGIARLGGACTLISAVGPDFPGSEYDHWLESLGVARDLFVVNDRCTPTAYIFTDDSGDQITFFEWGASEFFHHADAPALDRVHLATADPDFNSRVAAQSTFVSFDPGQDLPWYSAEQLEAIISSLSILFANRHEIDRLGEMLGVTRQDLIDRIPVVVITLDVKGSLLFEKGTHYEIPVVPVTLADPTGAGDAYRAGFLTAWEKGYPPFFCARIGTVTASFVVEKVGCQTNLPDWEHMQERYERHFGPFSKDKRSPES